jgi:hypothetical protein
MARFYPSQWITESAELVIGITPDNGYELLRTELASAESELLIASHTFRSTAIKEELVAATQRGVAVTVLLEGEPVGGIDSTQRSNCHDLESAGGQCWLMISDPDQDIHDRYRYLHAKYIIIDDKRAIISSENLSPDSLPDYETIAGTVGRRGVIVATDAPAIVEQLRALWEVDFDPANHRDLAPWSVVDSNPDARLDVQRTLAASSQLSYSIRYSEPLHLRGEFRYSEPLHLRGEFPMSLIQAPENALGRSGGLVQLLARAGPGDTVLVEQLSERLHWGASSSNPVQDPNPRLEALINAARRGAKVRLLLDDFFDNGNSLVSNRATCDYANDTAMVEALNMQCKLANPSGLGLHNKMVLAEIDGRGYVFVGSINGTELSHKGNREVALLIQSDAAYAFLADLFTTDWPWVISLPLIHNRFIGPAAHILISELFYDPPGNDEAEYIELYNPTYQPLDISGYSIGDALYRTDFEDVRRIPDGTILPAGETLVIAATATGFYRQFGFLPDFEIFDSDPLVLDLPDDIEWGDPAAILQLGNQGDEVILRDPDGHIVEAVAYGSGQLPGATTCPLNTIAGSVLERYPPWRDTDDCPVDFREWPYPNPGMVP